MGHSTISAYIKLLDPTQVTKWVKWTKLGQIWAKLDRSTYFDYIPENPPRITCIAMGTAIFSRQAYFRSLLGEMRQKTKGASIPSKQFEGAPPSPLPVGRPPNPASEPLEVNHIIAHKSCEA